MISREFSSAQELSFRNVCVCVCVFMNMRLYRLFGSKDLFALIVHLRCVCVCNQAGGCNGNSHYNIVGLYNSKYSFEHSQMESYRTLSVNRQFPTKCEQGEFVFAHNPNDPGQL